MAQKIVEGFDLWSSGTSGGNLSVVNTFAPSLSSTVPFPDTASKSLELVPFSANQSGFVRGGLTGLTAYVSGFWFMYTGTIASGPHPSGTSQIMAWQGSASGGTVTPYQFELGIDSSGVLHVTQASTSTTFASGTHGLLPGRWYFVEMEVSLSTSIAANSFTVRVNGSTECTVPTSTNTTLSSANQLTSVFLGWDTTPPSAGLSVWLDDFYLYDTTGASQNTFAGAEHIHSVAPSTLTLVSEGYFWYPSASDSANFTGLATTIGIKTSSASDSATFTASASAPLQGGHTDILGLSNSYLGNFVLGYGARVSPSVVASDSATFTGIASAIFTGPRSVSASDSAKFTGTASQAGSIHHAKSASDSANFTGIANAFKTTGGTANAWFKTASDSGVFSSSAGTTSHHASASDSARFTDQSLTGTSDLASAISSGKFSDTAFASVPHIITQHVHDSFFFLATLAGVHNTSTPVAASDSANFTGVATSTALLHRRVAASDSATFTGTASQSTLNVWVASASDSATFTGAAVTPGIWKRNASDSATFTGVANAGPIWRPQESDSATFTSVASETRTTKSSVSDSGNFTGLASAARLLPASASDSANFTGVAASNHFWAKSASDSATFTGTASQVLALLGTSDSAKFTDRADVSILLPSGALVPGGDQQLGLRSVLMSSLSSEFPFSYAQSPDGLVLLANGMDPVIAWDGLAGAAWGAGLAAPGTVVWLDGSGTGLLTGRRWAYVRYVDSRNNVSSLSPVSDPIELGTDGLINGVTYSAAGVVTIFSKAHGLAIGRGVIIANVGGIPAVNGTYTITVVDSDHFTLGGLVVTGGTFTSGGTWTAGTQAITYSNVSVPTDPKIARRQIIRNLQGDASVFYVDVDTSDLTSTSFSSSQTDEQLATQQPVPIRFSPRENASDRFFQGGFPSSQRHGTPPSWKRSLAGYAGRIFAAGDLVYSTGNVQVSLGASEVLGLGTSFTAAMAGRLLYVEGAPAAIAIESVDTVNQILTLQSPYNGPAQTFGFYSIRPAPVERQLVYYSESNLPESWPTWNAFAVPETEDEIVGLMVQASFLFVLKERNLFKFSYKNDPGRDGYMFPVARRGCVNDRSWVYTEGKSYLLDEMGVYSFDGDSVEHVSGPVSSLFKPDGNSQYRVDWTTDRTFWHAAFDAQRETIRWFVDLVNFPSLTYAICYNFRRQQWWLENFAERITASTLAVVNGRQQSIAGTTGRRAICFGQGTLDLIQESVTGTLRGSVASSSATAITDNNASFPSNLSGVSVTLITGVGAGQQGIVASNTSTVLSLLQPWLVTPSTGDEYQIGGVNWLWKSGWRRFVDDEATNPRDIEVVFDPTAHAGSFNISMYFDHSKVPFSGWGMGQQRDGIQIVEDSPNVIVSTDTARGYVVQRLSGHRDPHAYGHRYLAVQLSGSQGVDPTRVYQLVVNGVM